MDVRNPRTGRIDYSFEPPSPDALRAAANDLRERQVAWRDGGIAHRLDALGAWASRIAEHRAAILDALVADTGRTVESNMEIDAILGSIARWRAQAASLLEEPPPRPSSIPIVSVEQDTRPYPLVAAISPWNFPLLLSLIDAIPALAAGCAVLVKPSEIAPRFVDAFAPTIGDAIPLRYVQGDGATGEMLIDLADCVCFTGSVATGRRVATRAAERFIPAFLELGGKDPAIVLADADIDRASSAIVWGSTANAGQSCQSIERVYVHAGVYDAFVEAVVAKAAAVPLALPTPDVTGIGPIISDRQVGIIEEHLDDAIAKGAVALTGGAVERHDGGCYLRPTVLTGVDHSMKVMTEETFGPLIPIMRVESDDDAVALANDTIYGLSAAVFGEPEHAAAIGRRIDAGGISINDAALTALVHDGEKSSFRSSGLGGSRMGPAALKRFGRRRAFLVAAGDEPDPWWYPHLR